MKGFVIPVILSIIWFVIWALIIMKNCNGTLSSTNRNGDAGTGGPCCRRILMVLCFFQSFFGFLLVFSRDQKHAPALIYYPMAGFIAFAGNNPACTSDLLSLEKYMCGVLGRPRFSFYFLLLISAGGL